MDSEQRDERIQGGPPPQRPPVENADVTMYTTSTCPDCVAAKRYFDAKGVSYVEIDIGQDEEAAELVMSLNDGRRSVPTVVAGEVAASLSRFSVGKAHDFLAAAALLPGSEEAAQGN